MKKLFLLFFILVLLPSCGQTAKREAQDDAESIPSWQEQYDLGVRYLSEGNYEEAIIAFTAAIEIDTKQPSAYVGRGDAYIKSLEAVHTHLAEFDFAEADYLEAITLDALYTEAYGKLADMYLAVGDTERAIKILEQGYSATGNKSLKMRRDKLGLSATDEVEWTDPVLEQLIRDKIGIFSGTICAQDLDEITKLSIYGDKFIFVNDEPDAEKCTYRHLRVLDDPNYGALTIFYGYGNPEVQNEFEEFTTKGSIKDITSLRFFRNLKSITIIANCITDITVIRELTELEYADFWGNNIDDLSPIYALPDYFEHQEQHVEIGDILEID